jgi:hypothetical protein
VVPLMKNAGAGLSGDEIARMARQWVFWDWFRMAATAGCFFALLKAVTIPVDAEVEGMTPERRPSSAFARATA